LDSPDAQPKQVKTIQRIGLAEANMATVEKQGIFTGR